MFKFNNLTCEKCTGKLEELGKDVFISPTGSFVCGDCLKRFTLMKCRGCGGVFRNKKENYVWKGKYSNKIYAERPKRSRETLMKCHKCPTGKICQDFFQFKIDPKSCKESWLLPVERDYSEELLDGDYEIERVKKKNKTQMKSKRYLQPLVTDYKEGTPL